MLAVLHTWGQNLALHPHVHCVVTGGGLAPDESRWVAGRDDFFLADGQVTFRWKDYAHGGRRGTMTLAAVEFVRRFLMHVLPTGFVRVRYYGLLANRHRQEKLARCRELFGMAVSPQGDPVPTDPDPVTPPGHETTVAPTRGCP